MTILVPILFVIAVWWFSTGAVLWLAGGERGRGRGSFGLMTGVAFLGLAGTYASARGVGSHTPYLALVSALAVWAWVEFTFLSGRITGSRTVACGRGATGVKRFKQAFAAVDHHEYALVAALGLTGLICFLGGSFEAFWFFALLWAMRVSAKLTLFSGAPNFSVDMMPRALAHLPSYFRLDRTGPVFWASTLLSTVALLAAVWAFATGHVPATDTVFALMLTTFLALAVLEHWFMVLPVADSALWRWAMPAEAPATDLKPTLRHAKKPRPAIGAAD